MPKRTLDVREYPDAEDQMTPIEMGGEVNMDDLKPAVITGPSQKDYLKELAFMEELIEIRVLEDTDPNSENPVPCGVNGANLWLERGKAVVIKRKYVEALARSKQTAIKTPEIVGPSADGGMERKTVIRKTTNSRYPFEVLRDPNPRGAEWLRAIRASA